MPQQPSIGLTIRLAQRPDIPSLVALEEACFDGDRLSRQSFYYHMAKGKKALWVIADHDNILGYGLLLFRKKSRVARLYSLAVNRSVRKTGVATRLLEFLEDEVRGNAFERLTLEVRPDNRSAICFYEKQGFMVTQEYPGFYEDGSKALGFEKNLVQPTALSEKAFPKSRRVSAVVILVDRLEDYPSLAQERRVMTVHDYIADAALAKDRALKVINLSRNMAYLELGYYGSLLAEARGHRVVPSAGTLLDIARRDRRRAALDVLSTRLRKTIQGMKSAPEGPFTVTIHFGQATDNRFSLLARQAFDRFRAPVLKLAIRWDQGFYVHSVQAPSIDQVPEENWAHFVMALDSYGKIVWRHSKEALGARYALAILYDPRDPLPPSDKRALEKFKIIGRKMGVAVELITKRDYPRLNEFDALFIRETTAIDHHTFRFAQKAREDGLVVIDDPVSILRCTNKVYLAELLAARKIPTPKTLILNRKRLMDAEQLGFPLVLKIPDGSFSRGVVKVSDTAELKREARKLFRESDLLLAQAYMYTTFDWRVGILDGAVLFTVQYLMAKKHWQIYNHHGKGGVQSGGWRSIAPEDTPSDVIQVALDAAKLIGDGFYGVDLKQTDQGVFVIEINDNPSLESGVEDQILKDGLYIRILESFIARIESRPVRPLALGRS